MRFAQFASGSSTGQMETEADERDVYVLGRGLLTADGPRSPVRLGFPAAIIERWFPRLYIAPAA
jgi:hypothetical protein